MVRVAVLDDYQHRASGYADWTLLGRDVEVVFFYEPIDVDALAGTLTDFEVLVLMRERTAFRRPVLEALPNLQLLITTGMGNASVDIDYLNERGVVVCGTDGANRPRTPGIASTAEVAWALILAVSKRVTIEDRAIREGRWQRDVATNLAGATRAREPRCGHGRTGPCLWDGCGGLEPEPHRGARELARGEEGLQIRAAVER
jgi:lactate dehydrogenase-like 2-hydroxyacid dehydrogenase